MSQMSASHMLYAALTVLGAATPMAAKSKGDKVTAPFTDPATNITFQRFFGAKSNFAFGIALPPNPNNSFIGMMSFPLTDGAGWGGFSLTGDMEGPLLMAAWPSTDGQTVVSSFRQAANEDDSPPEVTGAFRLRPIAQGTSINATFMTYTFLCEGCLDASLGLGAAATNNTVEMGWALADAAVRGADRSDGVLAFHNKGFGGFDASLGQARNPLFDEWAALAAATPLPPSAGASPIKPGKGGDGGGDSGDESGDDSGDDSDSDDEDD